MNPYVIVNGSWNLATKLKTASTVHGTLARQQWVNVFNKNPNVVSRTDRLVILNNRNASINFRFTVPRGAYDIFLRCVAPTPNTDACLVRLDATKTKILDLRRRPQPAINQQITVVLFSGVNLSNGPHVVSIGYREPIGLVRLIVKKKGSRTQISIPAANMLYSPRKAPSVIQPAPMVSYTATTPGPIIPAEYKTLPPAEETQQPVIFEETVSPSPVYVEEETVSPSPVYIEEETVSPSPVYVEEETISPSPVYVEEETISPQPLPIIVPPIMEEETMTTTTSSPSSMAPFILFKGIPSETKKRKAIPTWLSVLLSVIAVFVIIGAFIYARTYFRSRSRVAPSTGTKQTTSHDTFQVVNPTFKNKALSPAELTAKNAAGIQQHVKSLQGRYSRGTPSVQQQQQQQKAKNNLRNKLIQLGKKYDIKKFQEWKDLEPLDKQIDALVKNPKIYQYILNFDPEKMQTRDKYQQFQKDMTDIVPHKREITHTILQKIMKKTENMKIKNVTSPSQYKRLVDKADKKGYKVGGESSFMSFISPDIKGKTAGTGRSQTNASSKQQSQSAFTQGKNQGNQTQNQTSAHTPKSFAGTNLGKKALTNDRQKPASIKTQNQGNQRSFLVDALRKRRLAVRPSSSDD